MSAHLRYIMCVTAAAALSASCGGGPTPVPLPAAYPRIDVADSIYRAVADSLPVHFEVNTAASVSTDSVGADGTVWLTVSYPSYRSTLYLTFTPVADDAEARAVTANRRERMALNTSDATTMLISLHSPGGFDSEIAVTPAGSVTPVQLLSAGNGYIVSGACFLEAAATADPDSVSPIVKALRADLIHAAKTISR